MNDRTYLGDGLYAEHDGFMVTLYAPREDGEHYVCLEPRVVGALLRFICEKEQVDITVTPKKGEPT